MSQFVTGLIRKEVSDEWSPQIRVLSGSCVSECDEVSTKEFDGSDLLKEQKQLSFLKQSKSPCSQRCDAI